MTTTLDPLQHEKEAELLLQLISELNSNSYLELSDDIEVSDKCWKTDTNPVLTEDGTRKFIVVGCSHASRLAGPKG
jgi:hypothetical protein